ncbi:putative transmembrane protein [Toxoplasma gondii RUB]|uniref:Putative transmembrane protein n=1 Tax=Toxoplasma gondii RUB TaxID=935652 RepID=A0A086LN68_TOXGO|nr:putative transmembrane protein [Toxoplasma gondii RUB]
MRNSNCTSKKASRLPSGSCRFPLSFLFDAFISVSSSAVSPVLFLLSFLYSFFCVAFFVPSIFLLALSRYPFSSLTGSSVFYSSLLILFPLSSMFSFPSARFCRSVVCVVALSPSPHHRETSSLSSHPVSTRLLVSSLQCSPSFLPKTGMLAFFSSASRLKATDSASLSPCLSAPADPPVCALCPNLYMSLEASKEDIFPCYFCRHLLF